MVRAKKIPKKVVKTEHYIVLRNAPKSSPFWNTDHNYAICEWANSVEKCYDFDFRPIKGSKFIHAVNMKALVCKSYDVRNDLILLDDKNVPLEERHQKFNRVQIVMTDRERLEQIIANCRSRQ